MIPILAVVGPTASGKTRLAIELARRLDTEIISADSMQFYRGMEIGSAAPTPEELTRVPHHFVGFIQPDEEMAAGKYQRMARAVMAALNATGRPAVVVGGSGLYIQALIDGLFEGPARNQAVRDRLKAEAREKGNAYLMARLRAVDPEYAATLSSENDLIRIVRALEVYEITGYPFSALHKDHRAQAEPVSAVQIALEYPRDVLYERINRRVDRMIADGWVEEVRTLIDKGYGLHIERLKALGFREIAAYLRGEQSLEAAVEAAKLHHRRYAKRQIAWFRSDKRVQWLPADAASRPEDFADETLYCCAKTEFIPHA